MKPDITPHAYTLLDIRGLVLKSILGGKDPDGPLDGEGKVQNTATYGFSNFMERVFLPLIKMTPPRCVIAVWDGGNAFRKGIYPPYKARRHARDMSPVQQKEIDQLMQDVKRLLHYTGCISARVDGVEADDLIAYLDQKLPGQHYIYTGDKDLIQLDKEGTDVIYRDELVKLSGDAPDPRYIALEKSLLGDTSDEYPGVKNFGPAKLNAVLQEFGEDTLEDLLQAVHNQKYDVLYEGLQYAQDAQTRKGLELLVADHQNWELYYRLACLHPELCEGFWQGKLVEIEWTRRLPNASFVYAVLRDNGCLDHYPVLQDELPSQTLITLENWEDFLEDFNDQFAATPYFPFDYETSDVLKHAPFQVAKKSAGDYVDVLSSSVVGMSITYGINLQHTVYISVAHRDTDNVPDMELGKLLQGIQAMGKALVAHNASFERAITDTNFLIELEPFICTYLLAVNVNENGSHRLKDLSKQHLLYQQGTYKETLEKAGVSDMAEMTGEEAAHYGCDDSACTAALCDLFMLTAYVEGTHDFMEHEYNTDIILYDGFEAGLNIDYDRLRVMEEEDRVEFETSMATLRHLLTVNCSTVAPERSISLYDHLSHYNEARLKHDGKTPEQISAKNEALRTTLEQATAYEPYIEVAREVKFAPTAHQLTKLANQLGIKLTLTGVTGSKITHFLAEIDAAEKESEDVILDDTSREFTRLLAEASREIKNREGPAYEALYDFCIQQLSGDAPKDKVGDELNLDSPPQMQQLLYCKMGLPIRLYSKIQPGSVRDKLGYRPGSPATDDAALDAAMADDCPEGDWRREAMLCLRTAKACSTRRKNYWTPYPLWQHPRDGNVHGYIGNCGTVTRRFTGTSPNELQLSGKDGGRVRSMVKPFREDHVILSPDLNGEELRITASMSLDPVMVDAYVGEHKKDLHSITAAAISGTVIQRENPELAGMLQFETVNGLPTLKYEAFLSGLESEDKEIATLYKNIRKLAKGVNFLLLYVGKAGTLARNLGIPTEVADAFLKAAFTTFPRLGPWQDESIAFARQHGYVLTAYGNRRHLGKDLFSDDKGLRTRLERQAVNSQVQGTGSDILKVIMTRMYEMKLLKQTKGRLLVPPYDEVAISVPYSAAWDAWLMMQECMQVTPPGHVVPQLPELKLAALNWGDLVELGAEPSRDSVYDVLDRQLSERAA